MSRKQTIAWTAEALQHYDNIVFDCDGTYIDINCTMLCDFSRLISCIVLSNPQFAMYAEQVCFGVALSSFLVLLIL